MALQEIIESFKNGRPSISSWEYELDKTRFFLIWIFIKANG
jgi:hypothetical protein